MKIKTLQIAYFLSATLEFSWSVVVALTETIGAKLSELTDVLEAKLKKAKS